MFQLTIGRNPRIGFEKGSEVIAQFARELAAP